MWLRVFFWFDVFLPLNCQPLVTFHRQFRITYPPFKWPSLSSHYFCFLNLLDSRLLGLLFLLLLGVSDFFSIKFSLLTSKCTFLLPCLLLLFNMVSGSYLGFFAHDDGLGLRFSKI